MLDSDFNTFKEAIRIKYSSEWFVILKDEIWPMSINNVLDLVDIPEGAKMVGWKWVYETKYDFKGISKGSK